MHLIGPQGALERPVREQKSKVNQIDHSTVWQRVY